MGEPGEPKLEIEAQEFKPLYRGVWADQLKNGQELPVGGSGFGEDLSQKLELDFDSFDIGGFTTEKMQGAFEKAKDSVVSWLKSCNSDVDPYTYFVCFNVQKKVEELLNVNQKKGDGLAERNAVYRQDKTPKLSELKGKTACAERAALGQYILQSCGLKSAYTGGISMEDARDLDEYAEPHSYIVVQEGDELGKTLIFDIAKPHTKQNKERIARVLRTAVPVDYDLLKERRELLVASQDVLLKDQILWFGVGDPVAGPHEIIDK
jgi:hypothetical protein